MGHKAVDDKLREQVRKAVDENGNKICECGWQMSVYTDQKHIIFLCHKCGTYEGISGGDALFIKAIKDDPNIVTDMIEDGTLKPWEESEPSDFKEWTKAKFEFDDL